MSNSLVKAVFLSLGVLTSSATFAHQGVYLTGGLGYGTIEDTDLNGGDLGRGAGKIGLGYQFTNIFALEGNAQYYFEATSSSGLEFTSDAIVGNVLVVLRAPLANKIYLVAKGGPGYSNVRGTLETHFGNFSGTEDGFAASYGAGLEFELTEHVGLMVEYLGTTLFAQSESDENNRIQLNSVMGNLMLRF